MGNVRRELHHRRLKETETHIGDTFRIGAAEVMVTQPRMPCYKLGIRFGRTDIIKRFLISERSGFYLSVLKEGRSAPAMNLNCSRKSFRCKGRRYHATI